MKLLFAAILGWTAFLPMSIANAQAIRSNGGIGGSIDVDDLEGVISADNLPPSPGINSSTDSVGIPVMTISTGVFISTYAPHYISLPSTSAPGNLIPGMIWRSTTNVLMMSMDGSAVVQLSTGSATPAGVAGDVQVNGSGVFASTPSLTISAGRVNVGTTTVSTVHISSNLIIAQSVTQVCSALLNVGNGSLCPNGGVAEAIALIRYPGSGYLTVTDASDTSEIGLGNNSAGARLRTNRTGVDMSFAAGNDTLFAHGGGAAGGLMVGNATADSNATLSVRSTTTSSAHAVFNVQNSTGALYFQINTSSIVIVSTGVKMGIGTNLPTTELHIIGSLTQSDTLNCTTGIQVTDVGRLFGCVASSRKLKLNILDMPRGGGSVLDLRPRTFLYKDKNKGPGLHGGFIAEEVAQVWKECVVPAGKDTPGLDPLCMLAHYAQEITALHKRIEELEAK